MPDAPPYSWEDFENPFARRERPTLTAVENVQPGDRMVSSENSGDLDTLADFPSVEAVVVKNPVRATRDLPGIRELLLSWRATGFPDRETLGHLPSLDTLYAARFGGFPKLDMEPLPAPQMRKLAVNRWTTRSLEPLNRMPNLTHLHLDLFRDPLDAVTKMAALVYLHVKGPAKGWAGLRACTLLEEAQLIEVQVANLRRWNTWGCLRKLALAGRGIQSLDGLEASQTLQELTLVNMRTENLGPVGALAKLERLTLRMAEEAVDLDSVARISALRTFVIDSSARDSRPVRLPSLKPLSRLTHLEEITLRETILEDGDLTPLADLPKLRRVRLGAMIAADVEKLRGARPDLAIDYTPRDPKWEALREKAGAVVIQKPGEGMTQWSIFQSLADELGTSTNYAAESRLKREIKQRDAQLAKRLEWDTEGGNVGVYTDQEEDIRAVAAIINEICRA
jgi:hypothetical protein